MRGSKELKAPGTRMLLLVLDLSMPFGKEEPFHIRHVPSAERFHINHDSNQKFLMELNVVVTTIPFASSFSLDPWNLFIFFWIVHDEKTRATRRKPNVDHMF